jgi:lipopolysaccharide export LptBFGC system permease protein LptF
MKELLIIFGFIFFATTSVFGVIDLIRQIKRLPNEN